MEEIIRDIVDADKQARTRVKQKQEERLNIQNLIQEQSKEIKQKYQVETKRCIAEEKAHLQQELTRQMQEEEKSFAQKADALTKQYEEHREAWVNEIVKRCLIA